LTNPASIDRVEYAYLYSFGNFNAVTTTPINLWKKSRWMGIALRCCLRDQQEPNYDVYIMIATFERLWIINPQLHHLLQTITTSNIMISAALLLLPALAVASPLNSAYTPLERRDAGPPIDQITIVDSGYSGNGCPQGSVSTTLSPDKTVSSR
jgi:hypothetical protein